MISPLDIKLKIQSHLSKGNWIIHLLIIYLILSALISGILSLITFGYDGFFNPHAFTPSILYYILPSDIILQHPLWYSAFTYNIIIFGIFLMILYIKYGILGLPIFLISYSIWDTIGILNGIYDIEYQVFLIPYTLFRIIGFISLFLLIILTKRKTIKIHISPIPLVIWFVLTQSDSIDWLLSFKYSPYQLPIIIIPFYPTILFLWLCYSSIKVNHRKNDT